MDLMTIKALSYEKLGMNFGYAMRLANLERLKEITPLSRKEEAELAQLQVDLQKLQGV